MALAAGGIASVAAEPPSLPGLPVAYDHALHTGPATEAGLGCTDCHALTTPEPGQVGVRLTRSAEATCHDCHVQTRSLTRTAPGSCTLCHEQGIPTPPEPSASDATKTLPASHGAHWLRLHGPDARLDPASCEACHARSTCIDCHQRKNTPSYGPHDRAWEQVHGIAAVTDPASCTTCHLQADCVSCHATAQGRQP